MTAAEFYRRLPRRERLPTSSQPAVVGVPRGLPSACSNTTTESSRCTSPGALSGTVEAARSAAATVDAQPHPRDRHAQGVDRRRPAGRSGRRGRSQQGAGLDEVEDARARGAPAGGALRHPGSSLDQAVKGGRVSPRAARADRGRPPLPDHRLRRRRPRPEGRRRGRVRGRAARPGEERAAASPATIRRGPWWCTPTDSTRPKRSPSRSVGARAPAAIPVVRGGPVIATHVGLGSVTVGVRRGA